MTERTNDDQQYRRAIGEEPRQTVDARDHGSTQEKVTPNWPIFLGYIGMVVAITGLAAWGGWAIAAEVPATPSPPFAMLGGVIGLIISIKVAGIVMQGMPMKRESKKPGDIIAEDGTIIESTHTPTKASRPDAPAVEARRSPSDATANHDRQRTHDRNRERSAHESHAA